MKRKTTLITDLNSEEAIEFLMKSEQYHNFELPEYYDFDMVLDFVRITIRERMYDDCISDLPVSDASNVNLDILLNKDGKYAVRPLVLCNPFLYYFLAREICCKNNWDRVKDNFKMCTVPNIKSCALPIVPDKNERFHKSTSILNWWNSMEQRAIELSLEYRYMFVSDITNCYGSVNPQTIDWALSRKNTSFQTDQNHFIALNIIRYLHDFQQGRNIGIPQGSTLFDLTAEIILSYSDLLLYEELEKKGIKDCYEILRYRDDYRIFCNDKDTLERISYILQQILESLNFRMNSSKTHISDSVITDSIKSDKLFYIFNTPIFNKKGCDFDGLQKHLLYILMFARKYPNSGQLRTMLSDIDERIKEKLEPRVITLTSILLEEGQETVTEEKTVPGRIMENIKAMCAVATQIAIENVSVTHYALRVISRMTDSINNTEDRNDIIDKICSRLFNQPNSTYSKIWLQNMTYRQDVTNNDMSKYDFRLCMTVMGENVEIWNNSWLKMECTEGFPQQSVVNTETLAKVTPIITFRETRAYEESYDSYAEIEDEIENVESY